MGKVQHKVLSGSNLHVPKDHGHEGTYPEVTDIIKHEVPTPATDGTVDTFQVASAYEPGTLEVFMDGLRQIKDTDYTEEAVTSPTGFTMTFIPDADEVLIAAYMKDQ